MRSRRSLRPDPRTEFAHTRDHGLRRSPSQTGVLAVSMETSGPARAKRDSTATSYIKWRVEGTDRRRAGHDRWPDGSPRRSHTRRKRRRMESGQPEWETMWFPHAFIGVMEQLQYALKSGRSPGALRGRQRQNRRLGGGGLPLHRRGTHGQAFEIWSTDCKGGISIMSKPAFLRAISHTAWKRRREK